MPQRTAKLQGSNKGRTTPKGGPRQASGRYTEPIPREVRRSPRWYPWLLLGVLLCGVFAIILNYIQVLPSSPTNWYTLGGLIAILATSLGATRYR
jgi:hypothetical protein